MSVKNNIEIAKNLIKEKLGHDEVDDKLISEWVANNRYSQKTLDRLSDRRWVEQNLSKVTAKSKRERNFERLATHFDNRLRRRVVLRAMSAVSAAVLLVSLFLYYGNSDKEAPMTIAINDITEHIEPAIEKPTLISGDNYYSVDVRDDEVVDLSKIVDQNSVKESSLVANQTKMQRFVVPVRYSSKVELSDGTVVHLNANSELLFPNSFDNEAIRQVELKGEGYFDVSKSDKQFIVKSGDVKIKVYGTKFNVNAYKSDEVETVLVTGSVAVEYRSQEIFVNPNELCVANTKSGEVLTRGVRIDKYIAWVDNKFMCEEDTFENLLHKLNKWYGIEFILENLSVKERLVTCIIPTNYTIEDVIEVILLSGIEVEFVKTERGYIIK